MIRSYRLLFLFLLAGLPLLVHAQEVTLPDNFFDETVADGWDRPVGITFDEQGRGYVWEKRGRVFILDQEGHKQEEPLIDISEEVDNWSDLGMLGFALDPNFSQNGHFYLLYVVDRHYLDHYGTPEYDPDFSLDHVATIGRITRYTADPSTGFTTTLPDSRHIVLGSSWEDGVAVLLGSHSVGALVFGQDGTLLASFGDGGSYESIDVGNTPPTETYWEEAVEKGTLRPEDNTGAFKSLQIDNLNGSIIRIDPETGEGIASNPFFDPANPQAPRSKIWATGFRNPFRFILIPETGSHNPDDGNPGTLFIGDVGGSGWEELNIAVRGGQCFGWPLFEGIEYQWGFFQKPTENPDAPNPLDCDREFFRFDELLKNPVLHGEPLFPNPCNSTMSISPDAPTFTHTPPAIEWSGLLWNPPPKTRVPYFDEETGELTKMDIGGENAAIVEGTEFPGFSSVTGFFYTGDDFPERYHGAYFHADLSGWIRTFRFNEGMEVVKVDTFARWDDRCITHLTYNPHDGAIYWCHVYDSEVHKIAYGGNPRPVAVASADVYYGPSPLEVQFEGSQSFDPDGTPITYHWDFGDGTTSTEPNPSHPFISATDGPESFAVVFTVTDSLGLTDREELLISLNNTPPDVDITSVPDGARYPTNGITFLPLRAEVNDAEHSAEELSYQWETFLHHNNHYHPNNPENTTESSLILDPIGCGQEIYWYRARLTVTDGAGLAAYDEVEIHPNCDDPFFAVFDLAGQIQDESVLLTWTTDFEDEVEWFEIERAEDFYFTAIGQVEALGMSGAYEFMDTDPLRGANYYRLKGVNAAGDYFYSNVIYIGFVTIKDFSVFPNPTENELNVFLLNATGPTVNFEIITPAGYILYSNEWPALEGKQFSEQLLVNDLPAGYYFYRIKNGDREEAGSFIKVN